MREEVQALEHTFDSFDKNLTDIAQHLSGTIADVRNATEALPKYARNALVKPEYAALLADDVQFMRIVPAAIYGN